jgi:hypothetical protein
MFLQSMQAVSVDFYDVLHHTGAQGLQHSGAGLLPVL